MRVLTRASPSPSLLWSHLRSLLPHEAWGFQHLPRQLHRSPYQLGLLTCHQNSPKPNVLLSFSYLKSPQISAWLPGASVQVACPPCQDLTGQMVRTTRSLPRTPHLWATALPPPPPPRGDPRVLRAGPDLTPGKIWLQCLPLSLRRDSHCFLTAGVRWLRAWRAAPLRSHCADPLSEAPQEKPRESPAF